MVSARKTYFFKPTLNNMLCLVIGIAINLIGYFLSGWLSLPIWGDVVGTIFAAIILGPLAGMVVGCMSGLYFVVLYDNPIVYMCVGVVVGLIIGLLFPRKHLNDSFGVVIYG